MTPSVFCEEGLIRHARSAEENLARLDSFPAPFPEFSAALRRLVGGDLPPIPADLPPDLHELLDGITKAIWERS